MGWEDRPYYRDRSGAAGNPLNWVLYGSVPLFTAFGVRVRAHASLVIVCGLILLLGLGFGDSVATRVQIVTALFAIVLLHEFGHCFAARSVGGTAEEIVMTPLGGLAMAMAPRRPWPTFVTVAGGPLVNVVICLLCGLALFLIMGVWPLGPFQFGSLAERALRHNSLLAYVPYLFWIYGISYALLIFNLLPVFPLDGGQLLQSILWKPLGYYRSMIITLNVGLVGSVLMFMVGVASFGSLMGGLLLIFIAVSCFINCLRLRQMMKAEGPWAFTDEDGGMDFSASLGSGASGGYGAAYGEPTKTRKRPKTGGWLAKFRAKQAVRAAEDEAAEQEQIDRILAKVSAQGMQSLTWLEKRTLRKATEAQRQRDLQTPRRRR